MPRVNDVLPQTEILAQLAEEAAELGHAALKLRRALGVTGNPTPVSIREASDRLVEEIADVIVCENQVLGLSWEEVDRLCREKLARWKERIGAE